MPDRTPSGPCILTLQPPAKYTDGQLRAAVLIATALNRGQFIYLEPPARESDGDVDG